MAWSRRVAALVLLLHLEKAALGMEQRMEEQFEHCCGLGTSWAAEGLKCEKFTGPVAGVPAVEQGLCLEAVDICCVRAYHEKQCQLGKNDARSGRACATNSKPSGDYLRDCCQGCKLGILTGSMGQGCAFKQFAFGKPWDPAFLECCHEVSPSTTARATNPIVDETKKTSTDVTDGSSTASASFTPPTPAMDDICQLMKGLLCTDICIPTPGSFMCDCREGFTLLEDGKTCIQNSPVDRCKKNNPCEHRCVDTGEAIVCTCEPGFTLAADKRSCVPQPDVVKPPDSDSKLDSRCPLGYKYNAASQLCDDVDECENKICPGRCENTIGSYTCVSESAENAPYEACPPGFQWNSREKICIDIDECMDLAEVCDEETHFCVNTVGSYTCHELTGSGPKSCPAGYKFDRAASVCQDVDECAEGIHGCNPDSEECRNTHGAYFCDVKCKPGFAFSFNLGSCVDVDECSVNGSQLCPASGSRCVNTIGSYACTNSAASSLQPKGCQAGYKPTTNPEEPCVDVNECNEQLHSCDASEKCVNQVGSYRCESLIENSVEDVEDISEEYDKSGYKDYSPASQAPDVNQDEDVSVAEPTCLSGYKYNYDTDMCNDINECLTDQHNCTEPKLQCINIDGSFRCECQTGFELNITTNKCQDIDECSRGLTECSTGERCVNSIGGHQCSPACANGLQPHPTIESLCQDIDECAIGLHSCPLHTHVCVNTNGSYVCDVAPPCRVGYSRDAASGECTDVDECAVGPGCRDHERCRNTAGSYECLPLCGPGWLFAPLTKSCRDVDECLLGRHNCQQGTHVCRNIDGSFVCEPIPPCETGYRRASNGSCADVDECAENAHDCSPSRHQYCVNRDGGFGCVTRLPACDGGYEYSVRAGRCEDVDECAGSGNPCDSRLRERCVNLPGSYRCERPPQAPVQRQQPACPTGYRYDAQWRNCVDIDECAEGLHSCRDEICYNTPGGFLCSRAPSPRPNAPSVPCRAGMKYTWNGCVDVDECAELQDACSSNEECFNTLGSFTCSCRTGFKRDNFTRACVDINECQLQRNECLPSQRCDNTIGSYTCVRFLPCGTGYTLNAATALCEDDDECEAGTHDCGKGYHCRNTEGSYRCDRDTKRSQFGTPGFQVIQVTTPREPIRITRPGVLIGCPLGYRAIGNQCVDVNECEQPHGPCSQTQRCVNTPGSYRCSLRIVCGDGYVLDTREQRCVDVDECADRTHECGPEQICENRQGGYQCSCPPGHVIGPNKRCIDIDECSIYEGKVCNSNSHCENTVGSYRCVCKPGFESVGSGGCQDVDECAQTPGLCQHRCLNAWGSYRCVCNPGFKINSDNRSCTDIDECEEFKDRDLCVGICQNTPGSYGCQCPAGYRLGTDGRTCQDIDECATGRECRGPDEMCQNTRGSFRCNVIDCPPGYYRDSERKNRCLRTSRYCQSGDLACLRQPSHYSFNFITFVSMLPIPPTGQLELFTMRGTHLPGSTVQFNMAMVQARAPPGVARATESCFKLRRPSHSSAVLVITQSIQGPQEIELNLSMEIYHNSNFAGSAVAKLYIFVSEYEY